ncbi:MAG: ABC transporter permease [Planctomycetota bacterium]|jgi:ribose transport system permease protein|nr:ABC transporter permease [Planctomycetota bacterium]
MANSASLPGRGDLTIAEEFAQKIADERRHNQLMQMVPGIILASFAVLASLFVGGFFTVTNAINILNQISIPLILATGITNVIIIGGIDLSIEGVMGFCASIVTLLVLNKKNSMDLGVLGMALTVAAGTFIGFVTGVLHVKMRIPSFMVSFGMGSVITGFGIMSYGGKPATVEYALFPAISQGSILGIPYLSFMALGIFLVGCFIQKYTAFARAIYAIGDNEGVLRSTGVNVDWVKIKAFAWCACCASLAGLFGAIRLNRGEVIIGQGNLFTTITALVVGGASLAGGKGGMLESLVGVVIVVIIQNCMILLGINPYIQEAVKGVIIILAVALSVTRGKKDFVK